MEVIRNPKVENFLARAQRWSGEMAQLRQYLLEAGLVETLKWGKPCYTSDDANIALIHAFKEYCAVLFFKGALLKDPEGLLIQQTENVQAARQLRFTSLAEVRARESVLRAYLHEAVDAERAGLKVVFKSTQAFAIPAEFQRILTEVPELKQAFAALTPGRQRAYLLYFAAPKQAKTRVARVEKSIQPILAGRGLND